MSAFMRRLCSAETNRATMEPSRKSTMFHTGDLICITRLVRRCSAGNSSRRWQTQIRAQTCFWTGIKRSGNRAKRSFDPLCWGFRFKVVSLQRWEPKYKWKRAEGTSEASVNPGSFLAPAPPGCWLTGISVPALELRQIIQEKSLIKTLFLKQTNKNPLCSDFLNHISAG